MPALVEALTVDDLSYAAKRALEEISTTPGWEVAAPDLIEALASSRRSEAATYLRAMGARAIDSLISAIDHPRRPVRLGVLQVLGELGPVSTPAVPAMIELLDHEDRSTRATVVGALGLIGFAARDAVPRLERTRKSDASHRVRLAAADALFSIATSRPEEE